MIPGDGGGAERRGMDPGVIAVVQALHAQYTDSHSTAHDVFVADHEQRHSRNDEVFQREIRLAADRVHEITAAIRQHYDSLLNERNAKYDERHRAAQDAISAALLAAKEAIAAALAATKEAINKSEASQKEINSGTYVTINDLQKTLATAMPRSEVQARFEAQGELINALTTTVNNIAAEKRGSSSLGVTLVAVAGLAILAVSLILTMMAHK